MNRTNHFRHGGIIDKKVAEKKNFTTCCRVRQYYSHRKSNSLFCKISFYLKCLSGLSKVLMRLTIQLKRRPYSALAMASLTSVAFSTVFGRIIVSPRVTTQWEVRASCSSSAWIHSRDAPGKECQRHSSETDFGRWLCKKYPSCEVWIPLSVITHSYKSLLFSFCSKKGVLLSQLDNIYLWQD